MTRIDSQRFWSHVDVQDSSQCWEWKGTRFKRGYGKVRAGSLTDGTRRHVFAHRTAWELTNGHIPDGLNVCHSCDNPACCNPAHLWLGTDADNVADMIAKGRRRPDTRGEDHPQSILTDNIVRTIHARFARGNVSRSQMAREYGVSRHTVKDIIAGRTWKHIATNHQDSEGVTE